MSVGFKYGHIQKGEVWMLHRKDATTVEVRITDVVKTSFLRTFHMRGGGSDFTFTENLHERIGGWELEPLTAGASAPTVEDEATSAVASVWLNDDSPTPPVSPS